MNHAAEYHGHGGFDPVEVLLRTISASPEDIPAQKDHEYVRVAQAIFSSHPSGTRRPPSLESTTEAIHSLPELLTLLYVLVVRRLRCDGDLGKRDERRG